MGLILYIIALINAIVYNTFWVVVKPVWYIFTFRKTPLKDLNKWFLHQAILIDVYSGGSLSVLFNRIMIKGAGKYRFRTLSLETISYTLGVNYYLGKLTMFGKFWVWFLNKVDSDAKSKGTTHIDYAIKSTREQFKTWEDPIPHIKL